MSAQTYVHYAYIRSHECNLRQVFVLFAFFWIVCMWMRIVIVCDEEDAFGSRRLCSVSQCVICLPQNLCDLD